MTGQSDILARYLTDATRQAHARLVEEYYPLVQSVCRRFLRRPHDVEDAVQETFFKLARHGGRIHGSLSAWLASAAHSSAIDLIRRSVRERNRRRDLARLDPSRNASHVLHQLIAGKLLDALRELDSAQRELIAERFFRKTPLRLLAGRYHMSISTVSSRVNAALDALASVLNDMGVRAADAQTLAEAFGEPPDPVDGLGNDPLRFAPDWRDTENAPSPEPHPLNLLPGWNRPLRVGVLISYRSTLIVGEDGSYWPADLQLHSIRYVPRDGIQLVSIIEPDTAECGPIERAMREHDLTGGLIDACDADALRTLDVIILSWNRSLSAAASTALTHAVGAGVGLLNEYWTGGYEQMRTSPQIQALMLAGSPIHAHHGCLHGEAAPAHMVHEHPLLTGRTPGMAMTGRTCGPVYKPAEGATILAVSDVEIPESQHRIFGLGRAPMPVCVAGRLGHGRVWVVNCFPHERLAPHLGAAFPDYLRDVLLWLAEPRRAPDACDLPRG
jgi:RNA polymerase sigma factor (sigma-70 family)